MNEEEGGWRGGVAADGRGRGAADERGRGRMNADGRAAALSCGRRRTMGEVRSRATDCEKIVDFLARGSDLHSRVHNLYQLHEDKESSQFYSMSSPRGLTLHHEDPARQVESCRYTPCVTTTVQSNHLRYGIGSTTQYPGCATTRSCNGGTCPDPYITKMRSSGESVIRVRLAKMRRFL